VEVIGEITAPRSPCGGRTICESRIRLAECKKRDVKRLRAEGGAMRLRDIMSEAVETISPQASIEDARDLMRRQEVRHLVVAEAGAIVGVLSRHDVRRAEGTAAVRAVMSAPVVKAKPQTTLRHAANLLRGNDVSCLPIVDEDEQLVGIITISDLLDLIGKGVTQEQIDGARHRAWVPGR
jgi:CBS domain-containing protein